MTHKIRHQFHIVTRAIALPTPAPLTFFWVTGSLTGLLLARQLITGFVLSTHYSPEAGLAFRACTQLSSEVNYGWTLRYFHANGARLFFLIIYIHIGRGMLFHSFALRRVWTIGASLFVLSIAVAFLGYVLPWGQMSYWGATVITSLVSVAPYVGLDLVEWVWGSYSVRADTLIRFFSLHWLLSIVLLIIVAAHLQLLHQSGSSAPLAISPTRDKVAFHPLCSLKDLAAFVGAFLLLTGLTLAIPYTLLDPDNFIECNPLVTPVHIKPEWYFLFAYAILRSIPNKLGGVVALLLSIVVLFLFPYVTSMPSGHSSLYKVLFYLFVGSALGLTWLGGQPVEDPYNLLSQIYSGSYFTFVLLLLYTC
jgi:ubiquinol-cytochrome c reductase cytochrome b subunit